MIITQELFLLFEKLVCFFNIYQTYFVRIFRDRFDNTSELLFGVFGAFGACNCSADVMDCVGHTLLLAEQTEEYSLLLGGIESKLSSDAIGCSGTA
jgi:hypothetical protein